MDIGKQELLSSEQRLIADLQDPEYRKGFVEGHAKDTIAFQLRAMRKAKGWDQSEVAEKMGNRKLQPMISRYENPDYGKYSISTLLELASAFDVALAVRFVPFSELVQWDSSSNPSKECPESFNEDKDISRRAENSNSPRGAYAAAAIDGQSHRFERSVESAAKDMRRGKSGAA